MSRTFTSLLTHLVFSTKDREPLIVPEIKSELYAYLGGLTRELKGKSYGINGTSDHVHMLISLPPVVSVSDALRFIKSNSSGWVHDKWAKPKILFMATRLRSFQCKQIQRATAFELHPQTGRAPS